MKGGKKMEDDNEILTQDEEDLEDDLNEIEEEEEEKPIKKDKKPVSEETEANETYEGFMQPARLGIINTVTGEIIEGFIQGKDEGLVQLGKAVLNKLDKIAIANGV